MWRTLCFGSGFGRPVSDNDEASSQPVEFDEDFRRCFRGNTERGETGGILRCCCVFREIPAESDGQCRTGCTLKGTAKFNVGENTEKSKDGVGKSYMQIYVNPKFSLIIFS